MNEHNDNRPKRRLPDWLKRRIPAGKKLAEVTDLLAELKLSTVCDEAHCPNRGECFASGTATFMILGDHCTRNCRFCAVKHGELGPPRADEPEAVAEACVRMGLRYVVVTSVTRDDLPDGGAGHFARTIEAVRERLPKTRVEVLTPDFQGDTDAIDTVLAARPDVFNHNVETIPRLYSRARPQADYAQSLEVLRYAGTTGDKVVTKSGLMVGLGETADEVRAVMRDLRGADCDVLTIGQYLAPSSEHLPVEEFIEPAVFDAWRDEGLAMGFRAVAAGPYVRSSYNAASFFPD